MIDFDVIDLGHLGSRKIAFVDSLVNEMHEDLPAVGFKNEVANTSLDCYDVCKNLSYSKVVRTDEPLSYQTIWD